MEIRYTDCIYLHGVPLYTPLIDTYTVCEKNIRYKQFPHLKQYSLAILLYTTILQQLLILHLYAHCILDIQHNYRHIMLFFLPLFHLYIEFYLSVNQKISFNLSLLFSLFLSTTSMPSISPFGVLSQNAISHLITV